MYMNDIKLFGKRKNNCRLIKTIRIIVRMEFSMLNMRIGIRQIMEGIKLSRSRKNKNTGRKEKLQVLGNIGRGHHQTRGDERKKF